MKRIARYAIALSILMAAGTARGQWSGTTPVWTNSNVGIGTSTPASPLHVVGRATASSVWVNGATTIPGTGWSALTLFAPEMGANKGGAMNFGGWYTSGGSAGEWAGIAGLKNNSTEGDYGGYLSFYTRSNGYATTERMRIDAAGNIGIGTTAPQHKLSVNGTIGTKEVVVTNTGWADYVLKPGYRLQPLEAVAEYIGQHRHLPGIPSGEEVQSKGVGLGEMQVKLLAKVEELTLHMIEMERQNRELKGRVAALEQGARE